MTSPEDWPSVAEFYSQRDVFITGGTGFMGKCLVEKLLRSVPDLGRLLILVRPKRGLTAKARLDSVFSSQLFDPLREQNPDVFDKVVAVEGDVNDPMLGLSEESVEDITENISVILHLAATVQFNAPMRESLTMNVLAVKELIKLCRRMKKLTSVVHVSTAYAYCNRSDVIEEIVYPPKVSPEKVLSLLSWMTDQQLSAITPSLIEDRPNTYTYTKSLAEYILMHEAKDLPFAILRPSIVGASYKEPFPGWVDCLHGPSGIFVAIGKGLLRVMPCKEFVVADIVPVDMVNNALLSVGWVTGLSPSSPQPIIYNYTGGSVNPLTLSDLYCHLIPSYHRNPMDQVFHRPWLVWCRSEKFWPVYHFFLHLLPGFFADLALRLLGKRPFILRVYNKLVKALDSYNYFVTNEWRWSHRNSDRLLNLMSEKDKKEFEFDMRNLDWDDYIEKFALGTRCYLLKESPANLSSARRHLKRLRNIRYTFNLLVILFVSRVLYLRSQIARQLWNGAMGFLLAKLGLPLLH